MESWHTPTSRPDEPDDGDHDQRDHDVLHDVDEGSTSSHCRGGVAGADQRRVPDQRADRGVEHERGERHPSEPGGDRDQRADQRDAPPDQHGDDGAPVEPGRPDRCRRCECGTTCRSGRGTGPAARARSTRRCRRASAPRRSSRSSRRRSSPAAWRHRRGRRSRRTAGRSPTGSAGRGSPGRPAGRRRRSRARR